VGPGSFGLRLLFYARTEQKEAFSEVRLHQILNIRLRIHREFIVAWHCGEHVGAEKRPYREAAEQISPLATD